MFKVFTTEGYKTTTWGWREDSNESIDECFARLGYYATDYAHGVGSDVGPATFHFVEVAEERPVGSPPYPYIAWLSLTGTCHIVFVEDDAAIIELLAKGATIVTADVLSWVIDPHLDITLKAEPFAQVRARELERDRKYPKR